MRGNSEGSGSGKSFGHGDELLVMEGKSRGEQGLGSAREILGDFVQRIDMIT